MTNSTRITIAILVQFIFACWPAWGRAAIVSSVRVDVSASLYIPSDVPGVPLIQESEVKTVDAPVSTFQTTKAGGNFGSGFASSLLGSGNLQSHSNAQATTVAGSNSHATADASVGLFNSDGQYVVKGYWSATRGVVRFGGSILPPSPQVSGYGTISTVLSGGQSINLRVQAFSGDSIPQDYISSLAALTFVSYLLGDPEPPLPGSNQDDEVELKPQQCPECNDDLEGKVKISSPIAISGSYLTSVIDTYGNTNPFFVGPSKDSTLFGFAEPAEPEISVIAYRYQVTENLFTHFTLPYSLAGGDSEFQVQIGNNIVPYSAGTLLDLTQFSPGGVGEFLLRGIDAEEGIRLDELTPFVSGLRFAQNGLADIRITPAEVVPEPSICLTALIGIVFSVGWRRRGTCRMLTNANSVSENFSAPWFVNSSTTAV